MAESKSISQLTTAENLTLSDLLVLSVPFSGSDTGYISRKTSLSELSSSMLGTFENTTALETSNKTVFGAINELLGFNTRKSSDLFSNLIEGATINSFSAYIGPRTITMAMRLQGVNFENAANLFTLNDGKWPIDFIHCPVSINSATGGENKIQVSPFNGGVYYYGASTNAINICVTYPYGIRANYPTE